MAIITPYADPSAHGKVTPGLAFKRRGNKVTFGANRRPRNKNTVAQQAQRLKVSQAVAKYRQLNYEEKIFLKQRGSMKGTNLYNLYISSQLKGNDWSQVPGHQLQTINNMVIYDLKQTNPDDMKFSLISSNTQAIINNTKLYTKLDSETADIVSSDKGPDFTWTGTPTHSPLKFDDGAFNSAPGNYLLSNDNGQFFKDTIENFMFSTWLEIGEDITDGKPISGRSLIVFEWRGSVSPSNTNYTFLAFTPNRGLNFVTIVNGSVTNYLSTDSRITFTAGEKRYISLIYVRDGIDGGSAKLKMYFGTDEELFEVESSTVSSPLQTASSTNFAMIANTSGTNPFRGGLDNVKIITVTKQAEIDEINSTRNIEEFETEIGNVEDNSNIFTPGSSVESVPELKLKIENAAVFDWRIPFYWIIAVTWSNLTNDHRTTLIRFPKTTLLSSETYNFWLSQDMSIYFDQALFRLGGTDNV